MRNDTALFVVALFFAFTFSVFSFILLCFLVSSFIHLLTACEVVSIWDGESVLDVESLDVSRSKQELTV